MINTFTDLLNRITVLAGGLVVPGGQPAGGGTGAGAGTTGEVAAGAAGYAPVGDPGMAGMLITMLPFLAIFVGMWFLMIRPQRKREKKLKELQATIKAGDNIVTSSGMFGKVADVGTDCLVVEMGISGRTVKIPVLKSDVLGVREPVLTPPPKEVE